MTVKTQCAACDKTGPASTQNPSGTVECTCCGTALCSSPCFSLRHPPHEETPRRGLIGRLIGRFGVAW